MVIKHRQTNYFVKQNEQSQACLSYAIAGIGNRGAKATQLKIGELATQIV